MVLCEMHGNPNGKKIAGIHKNIKFTKEYNEFIYELKKNGLYNTRAVSARGSLRLGPGEVGAKYLLLHSDGEIKTSQLLQITEIGPRVYSKKTLIEKGYPTIPTQDFYLVYKVEEISDDEFQNQTWDISKLVKYKQGRGSALPFSVSMTELMKAKVNH